MLEHARKFTEHRVQPDRLKEFCTRAIMAHGLSREQAEQTAEVLVTTDTWGTHTHGTRQLVPLLANVKKGGLFADAEPTIASEGPAFALIDGHYAMPMVTSTMAMNTAIEKARSAGIGFAGVRHSNHYGAAGYYAVMAANQGMIGLSMSNVDLRMTVPGSREAVIGTNPLAYAVPAGQERTVFMDIATSVVAVSKVLTAKAAGTPIPDNWLVDENGLPTSDPSAYPGKGTIVPFAAHKGYGIALFIEMISGVLTGAKFLSGIGNWLADEPVPADQGHSFLAWNVEAFMPLDQFKQRMDEMIREVRDAPKAQGTERIYLPGEMEWERQEEALARGMKLPDYVLLNLFTLARDADLVDDLESIFER